MSDEYLKHILTKRAEQDIPEMTDLKEKILLQTAQTMPTSKSAIWRRWGLVAIALLAVVVSASAAYAFVQIFVQPDPGIQAMQDDNQVVQLDITQPIELAPGTSAPTNSPVRDLHVTLDYAYADANRIAVAYQIVGTTDVGADVQIFSNPTLSDGEGNAYLWIPSSGQQSTTQADNEETFTHSGIMSFDASGVVDDPETLDLELTIDIAYTTADMRGRDPNLMMMAGLTRFDFSLPFNPGRSIALDESANDRGLTVRLEKVVITPSLTRLEVCFSDPQVFAVDAWLSWETPLDLDVNGAAVLSDVTASFSGLNSVPLEPDAPCRSLVIAEALTEQTGQWTVTLNGFDNFDSGEQVDGVWTFNFEVK